MRIFCNLRNSCTEVLHKTRSSESFGIFSGKNSCWGPNLTKLWNESLNFTRPYPTTSAFLGVCRNFKHSHSVEYLIVQLVIVQLVSNLHNCIFSVRFPFITVNFTIFCSCTLRVLPRIMVEYWNKLYLLNWFYFLIFELETICRLIIQLIIPRLIDTHMRENSQAGWVSSHK